MSARMRAWPGKSLHHGTDSEVELQRHLRLIGSGSERCAKGILPRRTQAGMPVLQMKSSLMRLFTAIDLPPEVTGRLDGLIAKLRPLARIRWSPAANLHITTKFVGQWPEE